MTQQIFKYHLPKKFDSKDFYISESNNEAYNYSINSNKDINYCIIYGPNKSGKTHLGHIWSKKNHAIIYDDNFQNIISNHKNALIDNLF